MIYLEYKKIFLQTSFFQKLLREKRKEELAVLEARNSDTRTTLNSLTPDKVNLIYPWIKTPFNATSFCKSFFFYILQYPGKVNIQLIFF